MTIGRPWGTLRYLGSGTGPLVVLLHPLALAGAVWRRTVDDLARDHRVVAPDARGHGESTWDGEPFTVEGLADDVAALIEHLDTGPARIAALSMGGCTAIALAARRPELVHSLALADTTADYGPGKGETWAARAEQAVTVPRTEQLGFQLDRWFSGRFREQDPAEVRRVSAVFLGTDSAAHAAACRALGGYDDSARLDRITAPTLVLVGEEDYATPPAMAQALHTGIAGSELVVLPRTRHLSLVESPAARDAVRAHLTAAG
ncbi:alpha/beta fold hydrolase [Pseudonocardia nematodicida]|uniref:Alpha/beta fold hydrolase n=1 Tax=Pseudonocardia nematodicida TaxID=1206997 RepID=A0ABV1KCF1_9PSEU